MSPQSKVLIKEFSLAPDDKTFYQKHFHKLNEEVAPTEFVGGFFPRKNVSIIASRAGVGKTWYLLKLFTDLSKGGTIFLQQEYNATPKRCLLFCGETGYELVVERINAMRDKPNYNNFQIISYMDVYRDGIALDLDSKTGAEAAQNYVLAYQADIVAFDTMMSFRSDDENNAKDTNGVLSKLKTIAENCNCAVIGTHHVRKKASGDTVNRIDQDEIIGSSAMVRRAGTAFILDKNGDTSCVSLRCVKSWWRNPIDFFYRMRQTVDGIEFEIDDPYNNITEKRIRCEKYIKSMPKTTLLAVSDVAKAMNVSESVAREALNNTAKKTIKDEHRQLYIPL